MEMDIIAKIYTDFPEKFGLPRQSGIAPKLRGKIIFETEYRDFSAVKELSEYSHIWLIWQFSLSDKKENWSPTVRPPRLGGNERVGVFASRSPYRPNPIGLSAVKLERVYLDDELGPVLEVSGIDMVNGTPIFDIKPYLSFADSVADAVCGYADRVKDFNLPVIFPDEIGKNLDEDLLESLIEVLSGDPRPHYHNDPERIYGFFFNKYEIKFTVKDSVLTVISISNC